jgi:hypothetical protein
MSSMVNGDLYDMAEDAATQAGRVQRCEHHDHVLLIVGDNESEDRAYAIATKMAKDHEHDLADMQKAVADIIRGAFIECPYPSCTTQPRGPSVRLQENKS